MTGSVLSLYLEETKTNEDSMFESDLSPIKGEALRGEALRGEFKNKSNLNMLAGARRASSRGKGDPSDVLSPTTLELQKVVMALGGGSGMGCMSCLVPGTQFTTSL